MQVNTGDYTTTIVQLIHIVLKVKGLDIMAMVETSVIHAFIFLKVVHNYGLKISKCPNYL